MIAFAGLSHLGLVSAAAAASKGFEVVGFDPDPVLVARMAAGDLPVYEPELDALVASCSPRLRFSSEPTSLRNADVIVLARDVPTDEHGKSDLGPLESLIAAVVREARPGCEVVVLSQVSPGFTRRMAAASPPGLHWYYQVETLVFGQAVERATRPERLIVGCEDPTQPLPAAYRELLESFGCPILPMRYESAELTKVSINMCLVASVTVANTMAELSERVGADWSEVVPALRLDRRIGPHAYLNPGLGLSGGNLERDLATVRALAYEHGTEAGLVEASLTSSRYRKNWLLRTLASEVLGPVEFPTVAVWGLAYKPGTHSTRNSPALALLESLGDATVLAHDPRVELPPGRFPNVEQVDDPLDACRGADALVIATPWPMYASIDPRRIRRALRGRVVIDPFSLVDPSASGLVHHRLGRPVVSEEVLT
ncbi:MAG: nucleotide sugar dehydrogenase [Isosphaeraceae bacterium]